MFNTDITITRLISERRISEPGFNASEIHNMLWREYFKMQNENPEMKIEEIKKKKEAAMAEVVAYEAEEQLYSQKLKDIKEKEKVKSLKEFGGEIKVLN